MGLFDNVKSKVADEYKKQQQKAADRKEERAKQLVLEQEEKAKQLALKEAKHKKILAGQLDPITVSVNLQPNEKAYLELTARRMASVDSIVEETTGKSKKKHVVGRAVVGGVLLGPLGAVGGAATAGSKNKSTTTQKTVSTVQLIDSGPMILTNRRLIFLGNDNVVSLPYEEIVAASFNGQQATIKYAGMLNGEYYEIFGEAVNDAALYYAGITQHQTNQLSKSNINKK